MRETEIGWYALSTDLRNDFVKKIKFTNVHYMAHNWGFGSEVLEQIIKTVQQLTRILPYSRKIMVAITYEIDSTQYEQRRIEYTYFDWMAQLGGFSSILFAIANAVGALDNAQMQVTSAMLAQEKVDDDEDDK